MDAFAEIHVELNNHRDKLVDSSDDCVQPDATDSDVRREFLEYKTAVQERKLNDLAQAALITRTQALYQDESMQTHRQ